MNEKNTYDLLETVRSEMNRKFERLDDKLDNNYMTRKEIDAITDGVKDDIKDLEDNQSSLVKKAIGIASGATSAATAAILKLVESI